MEVNEEEEIVWRTDAERNTTRKRHGPSISSPRLGRRDAQHDASHGQTVEDVRLRIVGRRVVANGQASRPRLLNGSGWRPAALALHDVHGAPLVDRHWHTAILPLLLDWSMHTTIWRSLFLANQFIR